MARGKYLSLEEARKAGKLKQFCKEHPSEGDEKEFDELFGRMTRGKVSSSTDGGKNAKKTNRQPR